MRINSNMTAVNAQRMGRISDSKQAASIKKLSSGCRVNSASDDAAGLAICEKMRAQIRGLNQAQRNAQDGLSLIQTAEGSIESIQSALQRMRELCVQAASDSLEVADREAIQQELDQLKANIADVAGRTAFNGLKLLDGSISANPHAVSAWAAPGLSIPADGTAVSTTVMVDGRALTFSFANTAGGVAVTASHNGTVLDMQTAVPASAEPVIEWQKSLGGSLDDMAFSVQQTADGGFIAAGNAYSTDGDAAGNGSTGAWVVKLDNAGEIEWQKIHSFAWASSVRQTADGGYIVAGTSGNDLWAAKLDSAGETEWANTFGGTNIDTAFSVQQTADGGYIAAGLAHSSDGDVSGNHGDRDMWVVKLDANGLLEWEKSLGGSSDDAAYSVQQTSDGGFIVSGYANSTDGDVDGNGGTTGAWVVKLDDVGDIEWQKVLGSSVTAFSVRQTADGGFIAAGSSSSLDMWMAKLDGNGALEWENALGGTGLDAAFSVQQTADGGYIMAGFTQSGDGDVTGSHGSRDIWVVKLSENGSPEWTKALGGSGDDGDLFMELQQTADGGYIIASSTQSNDGDVSGSHGGSDMWIVKLGPDGLAGAAYLTLPSMTDKGGTLDFGNVTVTLNAAMDTVTGINISGTARSNGLLLQTGADAGNYKTITINSLLPEDLGLSAGWPSALTHGSAAVSLTMLGSAINSSSSVRADLGAKYNALEHAINNLAATAENLTVAESRIRDIDMASEVALMTKATILSQAAQAMLAQANKAPELVLQLLGQ